MFLFITTLPISQSIFNFIGGKFPSVREGMKAENIIVFLAGLGRPVAPVERVSSVKQEAPSKSKG